MALILVFLLILFIFQLMRGHLWILFIDLVHIPIDERTSMDGIRKAELMKKLHEQVRLHIEEKTTKYGSLNLEFLFGFILARADFQANVSPS